MFTSRQRLSLPPSLPPHPKGGYSHSFEWNNPTSKLHAPLPRPLLSRRPPVTSLASSRARFLKKKNRSPSLILVLDFLHHRNIRLYILQLSGNSDCPNPEAHDRLFLHQGLPQLFIGHLSINGILLQGNPHAIANEISHLRYSFPHPTSHRHSLPSPLLVERWCMG